MFEREIRVRYAETDQMGVVYYANYFVYFEEARGAYLRTHGFPYSELERRGIFVPVVEAHCEYLAPARYEDTIKVRLAVTEAKRSSFKFVYEVYRDPELLARGHTTHVFVNQAMKPIRIPAALQGVFKTS